MCVLRFTPAYNFVLIKEGNKVLQFKISHLNFIQNSKPYIWFAVYKYPKYVSKLFISIIYIN